MMTGTTYLDICLMNECPDNWYDLKHKGENLLVHFTDQELQNELDSRISERRKLEIIKIVNGREPFAFYTNHAGDAKFPEWHLHIVFTDGSQQLFVFSSKVNQKEDTMTEFRTTYFPNLVCFGYGDYILYKKTHSKPKSRKNVKTDDNCVPA